MSKQELKEWRAGFYSGMQHDEGMLSQDKLHQAKRGLMSSKPLVRVYWEGYRDGMLASKMYSDEEEKL